MLDWSQKRILRFRNRCGISENAMDIFTYFRVSCCCLSMFLASVLARVCTFALHLRCGSSQGLWVLRAHGASTSHWWYLFGMSLLSAVAKLWETPRRQSGLALSCSSLNEGGKHLTGTLFLHLCVEVTVTEWNAYYSMWLSHPRITAIFYVKCPFITFILKPVSALPSGLALELDFWLSFGSRSGPRPRNSVWLAPHDYRLARNDFHNCGFAESAGIQQKGSSNAISMQKVSAIVQNGRVNKKHIWVEGFRLSLHAQSQLTAYAG